MNWITVAQIVCAVATVGLLAIAYDLGREAHPIVRGVVVSLAISFFGVFLATLRHPEIYEFAAAIAFTGLGVMTLAVVVYLVITKQVQPAVMKVSGGALGLILLLWVVGSCSEKQPEIKQPTVASSQK